MATNGAFNTNDFEGRYLNCIWTLQEQNTETNTSVISWQLKGAGNAEAAWYSATNIKLVINGITVFISSEPVQLYNGTIVSSGTLTVNHNADGTKTFIASAEAAINASSINCSGTASFELPNINRYATITAADNFTDDQNPQISFLNPLGAKLQFTIDVNGTAVITRDETNPASPFTFELTTAERNSLRALMPNSNNLNVRFSVGTFSGSSIVAVDSLDREMQITNAAPVITGASYKDTNAATVAFSGDDHLIIQNKSTLQLKFSRLEALKGSTLANIAVTINGVTVNETLSATGYFSKTFNFGVVDVSSDINAIVALTDTRGNETTQTIPLTVAAWQAPTALITCARQNNFDSATDLKVNAVYSTVNGLNSITIQYQTKEADGGTWGALTPLADDTTATINLDNSEAWLIRVIVTDSLNGSTTYNLTVDVGMPIIFFDKKRRSIGVNCFPAHDNSIESSGLVLDDIKHVGAQVLFDKYTLTAPGTFAILGGINFSLIDGLFSNYPVPAGYTRGYRITAQVTTSAGNLASVQINNIKSNTASTSSNNTMRAVVSTPIFKETDITPETLFNYPNYTGLNLYVVNTAGTAGDTAEIYNITVNGYLIKI